MTRYSDIPLLNGTMSWNSNRRMKKKLSNQTRKNSIAKANYGTNAEVMGRKGNENVESLNCDATNDLKSRPESVDDHEPRIQNEHVWSTSQCDEIVPELLGGI